MILKGNLEIRAWIVLLLFLVIVGLAVYVLKVSAKLRKYKKLYRSQCDITESISVLSTKLNTALNEIKMADKNSE